VAAAAGLRLAVHQDLAVGQEFLGVGAELHEIGELHELSQADGLIPDGHVDRLARGHVAIFPSARTAGEGDLFSLTERTNRVHSLIYP
jgi:hypothetical protein